MLEPDNYLPTGTAEEPEEEARLPSAEGVTFRKGQQMAEASPSSVKNAGSQNNKDYLSQPTGALTQRQKLLWLQKRRAPGLWVQCDKCNRWRFLSHVLDSHELPSKWFCHMNPDKSVANCSVPESPIRVRDEEDLIHAEYSAGSVVWARMAGWPWWPAMVDDDPDTEQYYWLDGFSDIPTHYNVTFFDALDVTRAWIAPDQLKPYQSNKKQFKHILKDKRYTKRMQVAMSKAADAGNLPLQNRLAKYSFVALYPGAINKPKQINIQDLIKYKMLMKRKYNVAFPDQSDIESDEAYETEESDPPQGPQESISKRNMILLGTPKQQKEKKSRRKEKTSGRNKITKPDVDVDLTRDDEPRKAEADSSDTVSENVPVDPTGEEEPRKLDDDSSVTVPEYDKDSMQPQIGSAAPSVAVEEQEETLNNDTSKTYVPHTIPESESTFLTPTLKNIQVRIASPSSDDFEF